jgi:Flp pilus assembly pilin Flp
MRGLRRPFSDIVSHDGCQYNLYEGTEMKTAVFQFCREEQGQDLIEYTLLLALIVLSSAAFMTKAGTSVKTIWTSGSNTLSAAALVASS